MVKHGCGDLLTSFLKWVEGTILIRRRWSEIAKSSRIFVGNAVCRLL